MATMQPAFGFDTLGFAQALIAKGYERDDAEALSVVIRDYVISGIATNAFVQSAVQESENRLTEKITKVEADLTDKIAKVEASLTERITKVETGLTEKIIKVEANLTEKFTKLDTKLDREIAKLDAKIEREVGRLEREMALMENRLNKTNAKMLSFAVGVLLAGIPIIQVLIQKLG